MWAETDDMGTLAGAAAVIMSQCLACHAMFRVHQLATSTLYPARSCR